MRKSVLNKKGASHKYDTPLNLKHISNYISLSFILYFDTILNINDEQNASSLGLSKVQEVIKSFSVITHLSIAHLSLCFQFVPDIASVYSYNPYICPTIALHQIVRSPYRFHRLNVTHDSSF